MLRALRWKSDTGSGSWMDRPGLETEQNILLYIFDYICMILFVKVQRR